MESQDKTKDYARIEKAIGFLIANARSHPSLDQVASHIGLSPFHFQRLFQKWAGISPKKFLEYLTVESAKLLLDESLPVLDAALELGLSGPSRLHDLFVNAEALTPGEYKSRARGLVLRYGFHKSPFGPCILASSPRGICSLEFIGTTKREAATSLEKLKGTWSEAEFIEDKEPGELVLSRIFGATPAADTPPLSIHLRGTNFQLKVWQALLSIPEGRLVSYGRLAQMIGCPNAARAVGSALGDNPIAILIPCHRVLRSCGGIGGYRWGTDRKRALIAWEASRARNR
ncbi:MAG TPA: methylated-DNA--[protein]-cysteine S-methyltransferase [Rectinemataceae bacterium]